jgi:hypothetical protein
MDALIKSWASHRERAFDDRSHRSAQEQIATDNPIYHNAVAFVQRCCRVHPNVRDMVKVKLKGENEQYYKHL